MFYALSKLEEDFFADSLLMYAAFAPCWIDTNFGEDYFDKNEFAYRDLH